MSVAALNPRPARVSPLIKFSRWTLLSLGVVYGIYFQRKFTVKENAFREKERIEKPIRDAKLAAEKKKASEAEMKYLEELMTPKK